jgi:hypothetical protein
MQTRICIFLLFLALMSMNAHAVPVNPDQLQVLKDLLLEWPVLATLSSFPWTTSALNSVCDDATLYGITQCDSDGWVTAMDFENILLGPPPESLANMSRLEHFYLLNGFNGHSELPSSWGQLSNLTYLHMEYNPALTGDIPDSWQNLSKLVYFSVKYNYQASMHIPEWIPTHWPNIEVLDFDQCNFNSNMGPIPTWVVDLPHLKVFSSSINGHTGTLPAGFATKTGLERLELAYNRLSGEIPSDWSTVTSLTSLLLSSNQFTGPAPTTFPSTIKTLMWDSNGELTGTIVPAILNFPNLEVFSVAENSMIGNVPFPSNLATSRLQTYDVGFNSGLTGTLPNGLFLMRHLNVLNVEHTGMGGSFPSSTVPTYCNLTELYALETHFTGSLPARLDFCSHLKRIQISGAQFNRPFPQAFANMTQLESIVLRGSRLTGSIHNNWTLFRQLYELDISDNQITGTVPISLVQLVDDNLSSLVLDRNRLNLCGNPLFDNDTVSNNFGICNVTNQVPQECGCPGIWTQCLDVEMEPTCPPSPPPVEVPPTSTPEPTSEATSLNSIFGQLIFCISALLFLSQ